jgi:predicted CXXCH cytochrome family protein
MAGNRLLVAAVALLVATLALIGRAAPLPQLPAAAGPPAAYRQDSSDEYLGSKACASCHQEAYAQWERSLHIRMTRPIADATVVGDFNSARLTAHGRSFEFGRTNGRPFMKVALPGRAPETFSIDYTLGFKRYQGYLSTLPDGRMYVLPAFWHVETSRWIDWKEITPIPDGAHDLRQIWNTNCFNCHATNLSQGFDPAKKIYKTTWTEMGIGCEACHGPGARHVAVIEAWRKDPSLKPGGMIETYSPVNGTPRQSFDTCAYCHGNKQNVFVGFRAGDRYEDYAIPFLISAPIPENDAQGEFWPDGRPNRFNRPQALTLSGCFKAGAAVCTSCHVAHGSGNPFALKVDITKGNDGDLLCTQCHSEVGVTGVTSAAGVTGAGVTGAGGAGIPVSPARVSPAPVSPAAPGITRHTFHRPESEGSRCVSCHMSDVNWRLLIRRRDHTFQAPVPEVTASFGVPNACTTCHDDRTPEWAAMQMDRWWGDKERRQAATALADTMYRAGSGDGSVLPALARLAVDRSQGAVVRASAVEFIEQLALGTSSGGRSDAQTQTSFRAGEPDVARRAPPSARRAPVSLTHAQVNALIGAAADPEPMVRAQAVNALLATGDRERVVTPLIARLTDPARVVRARAAEALLSFGIAELPGVAGQALTRAQDDFLRALSDFPDIAGNHTARGWLESERRHFTEAHAALDTAIRLEPRAARPLVIKGVIAARAGDLTAAVEWWRKAKSLQPTYPNIDQMISEAEKRKLR